MCIARCCDLRLVERKGLSPQLLWGCKRTEPQPSRSLAADTLKVLFLGELGLSRFDCVACSVFLASAIFFSVGPASEAQSAVASATGPSGLTMNGASITQAGVKSKPDSARSTMGLNAT